MHVEHTSPHGGNGPETSGGTSLWAEAWRRLRRNRIAMVCLAVVAVYTLLALYGEAVYQYYEWTDTTPAYRTAHMDRTYQPPGPEHWMGTDGLGRDVLQRLVQGTRIAYHVGIITSLIAIPIGVVLGCIAGYFGGRVDDFVVWLYSTFAAIPGLLFILAIAMVVGKGLLGVYLGIGLTTWVSLCRLIRGEVIKHKAQPYVTAAQALGMHPLRIVFRHILPNVLHVVIVTFTLRFPAAVGTEVFMSFLGIGAESEPSWGIMISSARLRLWQGVWWEMTFVTLAIFLLVLAFNLLGDALRDALDPRLRT
ncbi:ABC transporter permease [Kiritimatiella glycovorans]|uniref:Oligopeptide transport system permease protein OppC n=1 Tax=Kiritimatiella glycovorans TaxID=1307763 RepID=A0A0G3EI74_9BACT|nr:ABC transporter permease [Kiritimatiella glycovorans]AKJ63834.1 Oligopeptide transport system permease protein OppC [Kiritimatiella glycovorans]